jgi:hypothetical protein
MLARRLLLLAAVLMLLTALAAGLAPEPDDPAPAAPRAAQTPEIVEATLNTTDADQGIPARVGDLIRFEVAGDVLDQVQIERLDRIDAVEPTTPARFEVIPETAGVYPIRLIEADRRIGQLEIKP